MQFLHSQIDLLIFFSFNAGDSKSQTLHYRFKIICHFCPQNVVCTDFSLSFFSLPLQSKRVGIWFPWTRMVSQTPTWSLNWSQIPAARANRRPKPSSAASTPSGMRPLNCKTWAPHVFFFTTFNLLLSFPLFSFIHFIPLSSLCLLFHLSLFLSFIF